MKHISRDSVPHKLEEGETVIVHINGKEVLCKVAGCLETSCSMCAIDGECVKWDCRISNRDEAAFIPLEDAVE